MSRFRIRNSSEEDREVLIRLRRAEFEVRSALRAASESVDVPPSRKRRTVRHLQGLLGMIQDTPSLVSPYSNGPRTSDELTEEELAQQLRERVRQEREEAILRAAEVQAAEGIVNGSS